MKRGMTSVDVAALAGELHASLAGARVDKAFQPAADRILLRMRRSGAGRTDILCELGRFLTPTTAPPDNPDQPSMVAKILRRDLGNARLVAISQIGFDRLLRMDFERGDGRRSLVFELFGDGNMILLGDDDEILLPMRGADHGARKLRKGETYAPPPGSSRPFDLTEDDFAIQGRQGRADVVRFLAVDAGFGPQWAEELCARAGVEKNTKVGEASDDDWSAVWAAVQALGDELARNDLAPGVVYEDGEAVDVVPWPLETRAEPLFQMEEAGTFAEALSAFFVGTSTSAEDDPRQARMDAALAKLRRQRDQMAEAIAGFEVDEEARREDADALYAQFQPVQVALEAMQAHHRAVGAWAAPSDAEAARVKAVAHDASATLSVRAVDGSWRDVLLDARRSVQENADALYQAAKKAKSRAMGAAKALAGVDAQILAVQAKGLDGFGDAPKQAGSRRHFWFESYRWTVLPDGFLAVGGRNAGQNDQVVRKYLRDGDRYVHAQVHGAPSVVVRAADGSDTEPTEAALRAAGQFAACSSRAWRQFGAASAYWVTPQQVSKTPRSGEFVPKGAWIIHGKRNVMDRLPMQWGIAQVAFGPGGIPMTPAHADERAVRKLVGGPPQALAIYAEEVLRYAPGTTSPADAASTLAARFGVDIEEAQAVLPPGPVSAA